MSDSLRDALLCAWLLIMFGTFFWYSPVLFQF